MKPRCGCYYAVFVGAMLSNVFLLGVVLSGSSFHGLLSTVGDATTTNRHKKADAVNGSSATPSKIPSGGGRETVCGCSPAALLAPALRDITTDQQSAAVLHDAYGELPCEASSAWSRHSQATDAFLHSQGENPAQGVPPGQHPEGVLPIAYRRCDGKGYCGGDRIHSVMSVIGLPSNPETPLDLPANPRVYCELALLHMRICGDCETFGECVMRYGPAQLAKALPSRCALSAFFQAYLKIDSANVADVVDPTPGIHDEKVSKPSPTNNAIAASHSDLLQQDDAVRGRPRSNDKDSQVRKGPQKVTGEAPSEDTDDEAADDDDEEDDDDDDENDGGRKKKASHRAQARRLLDATAPVKHRSMHNESDSDVRPSTTAAREGRPHADAGNSAVEWWTTWLGTVPKSERQFVRPPSPSHRREVIDIVNSVTNTVRAAKAAAVSSTPTELSHASSATASRLPSRNPYLPVYAKSVNCKVYHHWYGIPLSLIDQRVERRKMFGFSPLLPREFPYSTVRHLYQLGMHDEAVSYELHRRSYFAWTHRRGGWSCMRHLELMSAGAVPVFPDLVECARNPLCLPGMPVELLLQAQNLPGVQQYQYVSVASDYMMWKPHNIGGVQLNFHRVGEIDWRTFDANLYFSLADKLLAYARANLTTVAATVHMLHAMGLRSPLWDGPHHGDVDGPALDIAHRVLVFQGDETFDGSTVIHGLAEQGIHVTVANYRGDMHRLPSNTTVESLEQQRERRLNAFRPFYYTMRYPRGAGHVYSFRGDPRHIDGCWYFDRHDVRPEVHAANVVSDRAGRGVQHEAPPASPWPTCKQLLTQNKFQAVIYFLFHRTDYVARLPLIGDAYESLSPHYQRVAFVDTTDEGYAMTHDMCGKGTMFKREMWHEGA